jgi:F-type H+-transporting ATPase subunit delta
VSVAATYAEALYESAVDFGNVPEVAAQLAEFRDAVDASPELNDLLLNPEFDTRIKKEVVGRLTAGANPLVANFMQVLLDRGRADDLPAIADEFSDRVAAAEGRLRVRVRTAVPLPDDLRDRLVAQISERTGRTVDIDAIVDPEIVGGLVIESDGSVVDASVRQRLADLRQGMLHASVRDAVAAESA